MEERIKSIVQKLYPMLTAGYHLPRFARIVDTTVEQKGGEVCDKFTPHYAVNLEVLDQHGKPDKKFPILKDITLPTFFAGHDRGLYGKPSIGTWVEIAFAYGSPQRPFIRTILPHERQLTPLEHGAQRWQQRNNVFTQADGKGNWQRETDVSITDKCNDYHQQVANIADRLANERQRLKVKGSGKIYVGNDSDNLLKIVEDTIELLGKVAATTATHTHPKVSAPIQSETFKNQSDNANSINNRLKPMVE